MKEKIFLAYKNIDLQKFFLIEKYCFETKFGIIISFPQSLIYNQKILLAKTVAKKRVCLFTSGNWKKRIKEVLFHDTMFGKRGIDHKNGIIHRSTRFANQKRRKNNFVFLRELERTSSYDFVESCFFNNYSFSKEKQGIFSKRWRLSKRSHEN